jgi:hypothetical protein
LFNMIKDASRLESGETVITDGGSRELRVFDPTGSFLRKYGGEGQPVSNGRIGILSFPGRITVYDLDDGLVSVRRYPNEPFPGTRRTISMEGSFFMEAVFSNGSVVAVGTFPWNVRRRQVFEELVWSTPQTQRYAIFTDSTYTVLAELPARRMVTYQPEPEGTVWRGGWWTEDLFAPRGVAAFGVETMVFARTDRYQVHHWHRSGEAIKTIRVLATPRPVTNDVLEPYRAWVDTANASRPPAREYVNGLKAEGTVPFLGGLLLDREQRVWVENYRPEGFLRLPIPREWTIFSPEGRPLAWIRESAGIRGKSILEVGEDYVLVLDEDEEGAQFVAEYKIESTPD